MPVLIGIPWLASVLGSLFTGVVGWLSLYLTKKLAITVAVIAAVVALTTTFIAVIEASTAAFTYNFPIAANFGFLLPPDLPALVSAYATARVVFWVYSWNTKIAQLRLI